jgi:hypothetical protein
MDAGRSNWPENSNNSPSLSSGTIPSLNLPSFSRKSSSFDQAFSFYVLFRFLWIKPSIPESSLHAKALFRVDSKHRYRPKHVLVA